MKNVLQTSPIDSYHFFSKKIIQSISLICVMIFFVAQLQAQIFIKQDASGSNDGSSWENAYTNLQLAIDNATANDQLWLAVGVYKPSANILPDSNWFIIDKALDIYGGFIGTEVALEERNWTMNQSILSGDINGDDIDDDFQNLREDNARHVLRVLNTDGLSTLDGITIGHGNALSTAPPAGAIDVSPWRGGGLELLANVVVRNCEIKQCNGALGSALWTTSNNADYSITLDNNHIHHNISGQGAGFVLNARNPIIRDCIFEDNQSSVFGGGLVLGNSNALIEDCTFKNNEVLGSEAVGGGIFIFQNNSNTFSSPVIEIRGSDFIENKSLFGGGLQFNNFYPNSSILIDSCFFTDNVSLEGESGSGGGFLIQNLMNPTGGSPSLSVLFTNSTLDNNTSYQGGGGVLFSNSETVDFQFSNTTFINNKADLYGGGLIIGNANTSILDCTFENNQASSSLGGGLFIYENSINTDPNPTIEIIRSDFLENKASFGGGIAFNNFIPNSNLYMDNCYFFQNESLNFNSIGAGIALQNIPFENSPSLSAIINNSILDENKGVLGGGLYVRNDIDTLDIQINSTSFLNNSVNTNGGGIYFENSIEGILLASINQSTFSDNSTDNQGAAIFNQGANQLLIENTLMNTSSGGNTGAVITNNGNLTLRNVSMVDNFVGIQQLENGSVTIQNTIIDSQIGNYIETPTSTFISKGGNISSDNTMANVLTGFETFADFNNVSPMLDMNYVPQINSPCIDAGNPTDIVATTDLYGADRIQGTQIDIGAIESAFSVSVKTVENKIIDIFPNPFQDHLNLSDVDGIKNIRLIDATGKIVQQFSPQRQLNISNRLPNGFYILELDFGKYQLHERVSRIK